MLLHLTAKDFEKEVLQSEVPVLVDFAAVWCGPCQMMGPIMEKLAADYSGKAKVAKVDIDESASLAQKYHIMSVPALLFFKGGKVMDQVVGAVPAAQLATKLDGLMK